MKLTNVQFRSAIRIGPLGAKEHLLETEGHCETVEFPWVRVVPAKGNPVRTTIFNIARCDDWPEPTEEEVAARAQVRADRQRGKAPA